MPGLGVHPEARTSHMVGSGEPMSPFTHIATIKVPTYYLFSCSNLVPYRAVGREEATAATTIDLVI